MRPHPFYLSLSVTQAAHDWLLLFLMRGVFIDLCSWYSCSANFDQTHHWKEQTKFSRCTNLQSHRSAVILKIVIFVKVLYGEQARLAVQLICHTKPYNNRNFQIDGASRYFGVCLLCLAKVYGSVLSVIKVAAVLMKF